MYIAIPLYVFIKLTIEIRNQSDRIGRGIKFYKESFRETKVEILSRFSDFKHKLPKFPTIPHFQRFFETKISDSILYKYNHQIENLLIIFISAPLEAKNQKFS